MKPKLIDRFILAIVLIFVLAVSIALILIGVRVLPSFAIMRFFDLIYAHNTNAIILASVGVVLLALALRLMFAGHGNANTKKEAAPTAALVKVSDIGASYVSLAALDSLVQRHCKANTRIRECESQVNLVNGAIAVKLKLILMPDTNIPDTTLALQTTLKEYIEGLSGITVTDIAILVTSVGNMQGLQ